MIIYVINYNLLFKNEEIHTISIDNKKLETDNIKKILEEQMEYRIRSKNGLQVSFNKNKVRLILINFFLDSKVKK